MTFNELNIHKPLLNALEDLGFREPTPIQEKVFSVVMSGKDVVGIAQTGTGKTLAYLLPCLRQWKFSKNRIPQLLIVVPTRELVVQVVGEIEKLAAYMDVAVAGVYGGTNIKSQIEVVYKGLDVVVATPGRLIDLALNGALKLKSVNRLVLDEVDEIMNLGFRHQLITILDLLPPRRQNLMFSATLTADVEKVIDDYFNAPVKIEAAPPGTPLESIIQYGYEVPNFNTKINLLELLLNTGDDMSKVLVFVESRKFADELYERLEGTISGGLGVIHSNKSQNNRFASIDEFKAGKCRVLIATDLISRGLDISEVSHVINFDTPENPGSYIHRIGRTGRADKKGISVTLIDPGERDFQKSIEEQMGIRIDILPLPENLILSAVLTEAEKPIFHMPNMDLKLPKKLPSGPSFHEKKDKNKKVNQKVRRAEAMRIKYGKPKKRGNK